MPRVETYQCDECGRFKGKTNHWWITGEPKKEVKLLIMPMPETVVLGNDMIEDRVSYLCGRDCLNKVVERFAGKVSDAWTPPPTA